MFKSFIEVRKIFLDFFRSNNHTILNGSSLIPDNDDSLLFTNAGMNQFKNIFLGIEKIRYKNIATVQSCLRVGGKHNDFNNIGYTSRHNTFFEMMGNFSFNSYFKEKAIIYAWELLTNKNFFSISKDNLLVTVHINDKETYYIWSKIIGLSKYNIIVLGSNENTIDLNSSNFWRMSEFGPCGYSTEIFFVKNLYYKKNNLNFKVNDNNFLEIWNLVFVEFNLDNNYKITNLDYKSVDTGMGLERICSVLQNTFSNFKIYFFNDIKNNISSFLNVNINISNEYIFNVISDHIRSIVFLLLEGVLPSNEFRGYILRKIIRRTIWHFRLLKVNKCILYKLLDNLYYIFNKNYVINKKKFFNIKNIIYNEELKFLKNLNSSLKILNIFISKLDKNKRKIKSKIVFLFYDTYGLPIDLIVDICKYHNIYVDLKKFNILLNIQKKKSRKFSFLNKNIVLNEKGKTIFLGYKLDKCVGKILYIIKDNLFINKIDKYDNNISIILDNTVLYPESGGQCGDIGIFLNKNNNSKFIVKNTKLYGNYIIHIGYISYGFMNVNDYVNINYDIDYRKKISCNHSSTHILKGILEKLLNVSIVQKGSSIKHNMLSFDFIYEKKIDQKKIYKINKLVNISIWNNLSIKIKYVYIDVIKKNVKNIFLENNKIRIIKIKNIFMEYCCGTHVNNTNEIGLFIITNIYNISSNTKRIEAVSYLNALDYINKQYFIIQDISKILSVNNNFIINRILSFLKKNKKNNKELSKIKLMYINDIINNININIYDINIFNNINFLVKEIKFLNLLKDKSILFNVLNKFKFKYKLSVILFIVFIKYYKINYIFCIDRYILNKINIFDDNINFIFKNENIVLKNKIFFVYSLINKNIKIINLNVIKNLVDFIKKKILFFRD